MEGWREQEEVERERGREGGREGEESGKGREVCTHTTFKTTKTQDRQSNTTQINIAGN